MSILAWFRKTPTRDVANLTEVKVSPVIALPVKTMQDIFDDSVLEVATDRVAKLIYEDLATEVLGDAYTHSSAARKEFSDIDHPDARAKVLAKYPMAVIKEEPCWSVHVPVLNVNLLVEHLAKKYCKEAYCPGVNDVTN